MGLGQATLASFSAPQTALSCDNSCQDCIIRKGPIRNIGGKLRVQCAGSMKDVRKGCPCWSDGKELKFMAGIAPPKDFVPKKWRGQA